jgi:hypothetical protein
MELNMSVKEAMNSLKDTFTLNPAFRSRVRNFQEQINDLQTKIHENFEIQDVVRFFALINAQAVLGQISLPASMNELENQFNSAIRNLGPSSYGINRTSLESPVTIDNIWIGDIYGFSTKTIRFWLEHSDSAPLAIMQGYYKTMLNDYLGEFAFLNGSILA